MFCGANLRLSRLQTDRNGYEGRCVPARIEASGCRVKIAIDVGEIEGAGGGRVNGSKVRTCR